ncbi:MAG: hypothetical protein KAH38_10520 [Candidatus Hydrogenedentes bacterium]|nr:hypothetical protein [Candidatus Hydrogenedentota bacterium]
MSDKRLIFLDAFRGIAISGVIGLHIITAIVFNNDLESLSTLSALAMIAIAPIGFLGTWAPMFMMISGMVNAYVLHRILKQHHEKKRGGTPFRSIIAGSIAAGMFLYLLSMLNMTFMHHSMFYNGSFQHTLLSSSLQQGSWQSFSPDLLFYNDALSVIAMSGVFTTLLLCLVWSGNGFKRMGRSVAWIAVIAAGIFLLSPVIHKILDPVFFDALNSGHFVTAFILKLFVGPNFSSIPFVSYGLIGALIGIGLARRAPVTLFRRYGYGVSAALVACGVLLFVTQQFSLADLANHPQPLKMHFVNLGLMLATCTFLSLHLEYCSDARRTKLACRTLWMRRFGLVTLTLFCAESFVAVLFSKTYLWALGIEGPFPRSLAVILPFIIGTLIFWGLVIKAWEKIDFKYSVEWWMNHFVCFVRQRPTIRLNANEMLYKPCIPVPESAANPVASD